MAYLYETHIHTAGVSKCASSAGADYIAGYIDRGYSGIIITDHFFNANTAVNRKLPWKQWVDIFCRGYEQAKEEGDKQGLDVFFGWEETFEGCDDYLIYCLDKNWLLDHGECRYWTRGEQYRVVRDAGGCVVQAHPFRQRYYINRVVLSAGCSDAVEIANGGNDVSFDALAFRYAKKLGLPMTAGTDIHDASLLFRGEIFGVYLPRKITCIEDYVKMILNNEIAGVKTERDRFKMYGSETVDTPVEIRDKNDRVISSKWKEYV